MLKRKGAFSKPHCYRIKRFVNVGSLSPLVPFLYLSPFPSAYACFNATGSRMEILVIASISKTQNIIAVRIFIIGCNIKGIKHIIWKSTIDPESLLCLNLDVGLTDEESWNNPSQNQNERRCRWITLSVPVTKRPFLQVRDKTGLWKCTYQQILVFMPSANQFYTLFLSKR